MRQCRGQVHLRRQPQQPVLDLVEWEPLPDTKGRSPIPAHIVQKVIDSTKEDKAPGELYSARCIIYLRRKYLACGAIN
jgi:hypothetical protein